MVTGGGIKATEDKTRSAQQRGVEPAGRGAGGPAVEGGKQPRRLWAEERVLPVGVLIFAAFWVVEALVDALVFGGPAPGGVVGATFSIEPEELFDRGLFLIVLVAFLGYVRLAADRRRRYERAMEERAEELARSNRELEQFAYVASHDLQEPLRMVSGYTQLLRRRYGGKLGEDADDFIDCAVDGANRMQGLINDLLTYSRVGTRGGELAPTEAQAAFEAARKNLKNAIEETGALVVAEPLPVVLGDHVQLVQLFQNLIGNAIKFRHPEHETPEVSVAATLKEGAWLFSVRDNGIGMDPRYAERIFVIFQRLHTSSEYPGTGIGLAVCKKIVERHGGKIWVESEPGRGSASFFTLRPAEPSRKRRR